MDNSNASGKNNMTFDIETWSKELMDSLKSYRRDIMRWEDESKANDSVEVLEQEMSERLPSHCNSLMDRAYFGDSITPEEVFKASQEEAEKDLKAGLLGFKTLGLIDDPDFVVASWKRLGVRCNIIAGDCVTTYEVTEQDGYNSVMFPEIKKKFGENIFKQMREFEMFELYLQDIERINKKGAK